jgi:hypothetical protein
LSFHLIPTLAKQQRRRRKPSRADQIERWLRTHPQLVSLVRGALRYVAALPLLKHAVDVIFAG